MRSFAPSRPPGLCRYSGSPVLVVRVPFGANRAVAWQSSRILTFFERLRKPAVSRREVGGSQSRKWYGRVGNFSAERWKKNLIYRIVLEDDSPRLQPVVWGSALKKDTSRLQVTINFSRVAQMKDTLSMLLEKQKELLHHSYVVKCANRQGLRKFTADKLEEAFCGLVTEIQPEISIEIGAHEASYSERIARSCPHTRILAFEANPYVYEHFARRLSNRIEYINAAVCRSHGDTVILYVPSSRLDQKIGRRNAISSLRVRNYSDYEYLEVAVKSINLDEFLKSQATRSTVMWIDVEGAQEHVLASAKVCLEQSQAVYIEMEEVEVWARQPLASIVSKRMHESGFREVMRDAIADIQFNAIFIRNNQSCNATAEKFSRWYCDEIQYAIEKGEFS